MRPIRLSIIGNPDSVHVSRWARHFADHGFDVTVLSFYQSNLRGGDHLHPRYLRPRKAAAGAAAGGRRTRIASGLGRRLPGTMRIVTAARYGFAGFRRQLRELSHWEGYGTVARGVNFLWTLESKDLRI